VVGATSSERGFRIYVYFGFNNSDGFPHAEHNLLSIEAFVFPCLFIMAARRSRCGHYIFAL